MSDLDMIQARRFLCLNSSIELFFSNYKSCLLSFSQTDDRDQLGKVLAKYRNKKITESKDFSIIEGRKALEKHKLTEKWQNHQISNFEYLMNLNSFAGRSYNDMSQYPVFPWIHMPGIKTIDEATLMTSDDLTIFRDLSKNMGQLGSKERIEELQRRFEEGDPFEDDNYHYGSHYSHPGIVIHSLI